MAYAGSQKFEKRLTRIEKQRRKLARGAVYAVNQDGLIVARPRRRSTRRPLRFVFFVLAGVMTFKSVLYSHLGAGTYASRVEELSVGTAVEQAGAWVMTADPATIWLAMQFKLLIG